MTIRTIAGLVCASATALLAQSGGGPGPGGGSGGSGGSTQQVALFIPSETAPPGGIAQMKFMVTEPTPISTGRPVVTLDAATFDTVCGIQLFNAAGDLNGVAMVNGSHVQIAYITSTGAQGTDYPIMTLALHIRPDALPGSKSLFSLDPSSSWVLGSLGSATMKPMPPATVTVGGTISIMNVVPGGGMLPAGTVVHILGMGFQPKTQVQLSGITFSSIQFVSPEEIEFTVAQATNMTGKKIHAVNPDGSQDTYFSYMRGIPMGQSNQPLLANAVPVFSSMMYSAAVFNPIAPANSAQFTGIAMQNPELSDVQATVSLYSSANVLLGSSTITIPSGQRLMRAISEFAQGAAPTFGSYAVVTASQPVQVFGFLGDNSAGTVTPFAAVLTRP